MADVPANQPLVLSVLDRLLDEDPAVTREAVKPRPQLLRELKQAVRRDLENLLNTRRRCLGWPAALKELERSVVAYGLPDFTGAPMASPQAQERFRRTLEGVLRTFEPRFKKVTVQMLSNVEPLDRTLRFRIDGLLYADPAPEPVIFDSALEPISGTFQVKGGSG